jgi:hypothetical protein
MSGASTLHTIIFVFLILLALATTGAAVVIIPAAVRSHRASTMRLSQGESFRRAYGQCSDAVDSVIAELEAHPQDYVTFPQTVRDQLISAHEAVSAAERKRN